MQRLSTLGHLSMVEEQSLGEACTSNPSRVQREQNGAACQEPRHLQEGEIDSGEWHLWGGPCLGPALIVHLTACGKKKVSASSEPTTPAGPCQKSGRPLSLEPRTSTMPDSPRFLSEGKARTLRAPHPHLLHRCPSLGLVESRARAQHCLKQIITRVRGSPAGLRFVVRHLSSQAACQSVPDLHDALPHRLPSRKQVNKHTIAA